MNTRFSFQTFLLLLLFGQANLSAQEWQKVMELPAILIPDISVQGDTIFAAGINKFYYSFDGGNSWDSTAVIDPELDYITDVVHQNARLYVATGNMGIWSSTNGGQNWQEDNSGLSGLGALHIAGFAVRGDSLYAGTYGAGVFVKKISTNSSWSTYNQGIPWGSIESLHNIDGRLFAGTGANGTMSHQAYPGHTWTEIPFDAFDGQVNFFLGVVRQGDVLLAAGTRKLYRSTDEGATWTSYNPGTGYLGLARFVVNGHRVYVQLAKPAGLSFMLYTDDQGENWHTFQPALSGSAGYDLAICNGWLYAARDNGLWRIALTTPLKEPEAEFPGLGQNFPNPFSSTTTIPFTLQQQEKVEITVYNTAGTLVRTISSGEQPAGAYQIAFDAADLPTGVYIYCITTPSGAVTRLMLLER